MAGAVFFLSIPSLGDGRLENFFFRVLVKDALHVLLRSAHSHDFADDRRLRDARQDGLRGGERARILGRLRSWQRRWLSRLLPPVDRVRTEARLVLRHSALHLAL